MVDFIELLGATIAIIVTTVTALISLAYWLGSRLASIEGRFTVIENRFTSIENRFTEMENRLAGYNRTVITFNEALLRILGEKGIIGSIESSLLIDILRTGLTQPQTKYYTKEVYEKLKALLEKSLDSYTWEDTEELEWIAELIFKEASITEDERKKMKLMDYAARLQQLAVYIRATVLWPKLKKKYEEKSKAKTSI